MSSQIVLPSGASGDTFPHNRMGAYSVLLKEPIENMGGDEYVALANISLPRDFLTLARRDRFFSVYILHVNRATSRRRRRAAAADPEAAPEEEEEVEEAAEVITVDGPAPDAAAAAAAAAAELADESGDEDSDGDDIDYERHSVYTASSEQAQSPLPEFDEPSYRRLKNLPPSTRLVQHRFLVKADPLPIGHFDTDAELIKYMNEALESALRRTHAVALRRRISLPTDVEIRLHLDNEGRVKLQTNFAIAELHLRNALATLLGFRSQFPLCRWSLPLRAAYPADSQRGLHNIYIYLSNIDYAPVGHAIAPLLSIVPVSFGRGADRGRGAFTFEPLHLSWHRLSQSRIGTFTVNLRDERGRIVKFRRGSVILTLHRRVGMPPLL